VLRRPIEITRVIGQMVLVGFTSYVTPLIEHFREMSAIEAKLSMESGFIPRVRVLSL
jgi:hypothetical protein